MLRAVTISHRGGKTECTSVLAGRGTLSRPARPKLRTLCTVLRDCSGPQPAFVSVAMTQSGRFPTDMAVTEGGQLPAPTGAVSCGRHKKGAATNAKKKSHSLLKRCQGAGQS